ncbi:MAG: polysaccharide biosynthesis/export family protein [Paracoccaceae bacterium]
MARMLLSVLALFIFGSIAAAQDSYKIRPGDVLRIEVLEDQTLNRDAIVLPDGTVTVPLVGSVRAGGQSLDTIRSSIASGLAPNFASSPNVFVTISSLAAAQPLSGRASPATMDVFVMGEVGSPGKASIERGTNLLQFLAQSGGFTKFAATKRIQVRRTDPKTGQALVYTFNYRAVEQGNAPVSSIVLQDGDIIVVPERRLFE